MKAVKLSFLGISIILVLIVTLFGYKDIPLEELKDKYAPPPSSFMSVDGMDVHFRDEGDPSGTIPIVLIHGTGASLHTFNDWTDKLSENYRVIRMDLPGYGLTGPFPHRDYSIENYLTFLKHFLDAKGISQCIIGGNSLGGQIAWRFTVAYPEMIEKLLLIDAAGYPYQAQSSPLAFRVAKLPVLKNLFTFITPKPIARSSVENVYADKTKVTDDLADRYFELTLREGNRRAFVDRFDAKSDPNAYKRIKSITQPTLILWGEEDRLIPVENGYRFQEDLPNDSLVIIPNSGHVPMEEDPDQSLEPVLKFLEK